MYQIRHCANCSQGRGIELHHIVFRSQQKAMEKCPLNHVYLCSDCHRGDKGPHNNRKRDLELKRNLQDKLELLFDKESFTMEEIKEVLKISDNAVIRLCKPLKRTVDKYDREDIIRSCMGGRIYE